MFTPAARKRLMERLRRFFGGQSCHVQVAALPWRMAAGELQVMLITSRGTGRWIVPKGWPEDGEPFFDAAAREAGEEAGVAGSVSSRSLGSYTYDKVRASGKEMKCEVVVYPLRVDHIADAWRERHQRERRWMRPDEAASLVHEPDLAELISRFPGAARQSAAA